MQFDNNTTVHFTIIIGHKPFSYTSFNIIAAN